MHDFLKLIWSLLRRSVVIAVLAAAVCAVVLAGAYFVFRAKTKGTRKFPWRKAVLILLLAGYAAVLLYATLLRYTGGGADVNLHLFRAWREAWNAWSLKGWLNVLLNVALFVPLGVLLPPLFRHFRKWYVTLPAGFGVSLLIEGIQFFSSRGIFDVDDLFANTLGCVLGFCAVMALLKLLSREAHKGRRSLAYLACPLAFAVALAGLYAGYQLQEYGNLEESPAFNANTKNVVWTLACELDDSVQSIPVYRTEPFDKESCDAFGAAFAANLGITFPDISYYDNASDFTNHSTGDFLYVNYQDGSYEYWIGGVNSALEAVEVDEAALRQLLAPYGVAIPETAEFSYDGRYHTFMVHMEADGDRVLDGTLRCLCREGPVLDRIENHMISYEYYKDETVISQSEAYERLCGGKFYDSARFEAYAPSQVTVEACTLEYRIDSKGFYRPVYVFQVAAGEADVGELVVPA